MGVIFISHSSHDDTEAIAISDWLKEHGWGDVFLDLLPVGGFCNGVRWRDELRRAG